jgi:SnoaL-like polyketide cyclase
VSEPQPIGDAQLERSHLNTLAERFTAGFTGGGFAAACTPDVDYEDPLVVHPLHGLDELEGHAASLREAFPDLRIERPSAPIAGGVNACIPWRAVGTHKGQLAVLPPTERFLTVSGLHWVELSDGLVRRARGFFDLYGAATQLGLLPERGGLGETALLLLRGFGLRRPGAGPT